MTGLLLLGAGFLLGRMSAPERKPEAPEETVQRAPAPAPDAPPLLAGRPTEERAVAPAETIRRLREIVDEIQIPAIPTGTGVIEGAVRASDGHGVAGVEMTLAPQPPSSFPRVGWGSDADPGEAMAAGAIWQKWTRAARRTTTTGGDGTYRFDGLADLDHDLSAKLAGWRISRAPSPSGGRGGGGSRVRPGQAVDFVAQEIAEVDVDVRLPDGRAPDEATITFQAEGNTRGHGWRPQNATITLEPGRYEAFASSGPRGTLRSERSVVTLEAGRRTTLRLDLVAGRALLVRVRFAEGEEFAGARVIIARLAAGAAVDAALLANPTADQDVRDGIAAFDDPANGRYLVGLQRTRQGVVVATTEANVADGPAEVEVRAPALRREEYVVIRVTGPDGKPIRNPQVSLGFESPSNSSSYGGGPMLERPDGSLWLLHGIVGPVPSDARRWVRVSAQRLGERTVEYADDAPDISVRLQPPVALDVVVRGVPARYEGRLQVRADEAPGTRISGRPVPLGSDGKARIESIQPGREVVAILARIGDNSAEVARTEVDVAPGMEPVVLDLPPLHAVALVGVESGHVFVSRTDRGAGRWFASLQVPAGTGRATLDALPAGEYEARSGPRTATFRVPGPEEVVFR